MAIGTCRNKEPVHKCETKSARLPRGNQRYLAAPGFATAAVNLISGNGPNAIQTRRLGPSVFRRQGCHSSSVYLMNRQSNNALARIRSGVCDGVEKKQPAHPQTFFINVTALMSDSCPCSRSFRTPRHQPTSPTLHNQLGPVKSPKKSA